MITLALSKGRIFEDTVPLLRAAGIELLDDPETSRKLILATSQPEVRVLVVRATDRCGLSRGAGQPAAGP